LKPSLHRDAIELSAESANKDTVSDMIKEVERLLLAEEERLTGVTAPKKR
jgi:hypothetical protein